MWPVMATVRVTAVTPSDRLMAAAANASRATPEMFTTLAPNSATQRPIPTEHSNCTSVLQEEPQTGHTHTCTAGNVLLWDEDGSDEAAEEEEGGNFSRVDFNGENLSDTSAEFTEGPYDMVDQLGLSTGYTVKPEIVHTPGKF
ncbi:hypothetical protein F2P81_013160 [Scophthalmus maximus]|uniref:Uncharacterized protein n=1 Tax=Scophthalmus maximus TaxID=52904 RepID=A0A6A4SZF5_SCOMX|nr:hypothetical protein F2P81_013160 [Scophthalmus maximus]